MSDLPASIIVPSYRSSATIRACLTALLKQDFGLPYEIIVIDSSPDQTPEMIRREFPQVHLIHLPEQTDPAQARNVGARQAHGELLAFIDADCIAAHDWLRRLCALVEQGYAAAGGAIGNANGESLVSWAGYLCEFREFLPGSPARDVSNLTLGNAAYRAKVFKAEGGFPVGYFPQEDQVFHDRLCQKGLRMRLDPGVVVRHFHRAERAEFLNHQRHIGQANARVLQGLNRQGSSLARRPALARLALPALVALRFFRTVRATWNVERALMLRRPALAWLCWRGTCWWGLGFLEGVRQTGQMPIVQAVH